VKVLLDYNKEIGSLFFSSSEFIIFAYCVSNGTGTPYLWVPSQKALNTYFVYALIYRHFFPMFIISLFSIIQYVTLFCYSYLSSCYMNPFMSNFPEGNEEDQGIFVAVCLRAEV
jgi:hypothetical protein